jgi:DNA-binding MarR family transcriptional regulator
VREIILVKVTTAQVGQLLDQLWAVTQTVRRGQRANAADPVTIKLLSLAAERDNLRPQDVVNLLEVTPPSATRYVQMLEKAGQISLTEDPTDGRTYLIRITEQGAEVLAALQEQLRDRMRPVLADWQSADVAQLIDLLGRLNRSMEEQLERRPDRPMRKNRWRQAAS